MDTQHTKVSFTLQAILIMSLMTMAISGAFLYALVNVHQQQQKPPPSRRPSGEIGNMSAEVIEAEYGPVNKQALHETKEGIFARIRAARQGCNPCVTPQRQVWCSQASSYYGTPTYYYASTVVSPVVVRQVPTVVSPVSQPQATPILTKPNPLKIQPSCESGQCDVQLSIKSSDQDYVIQIKPSI